MRSRKRSDAGAASQEPSPKDITGGPRARTKNAKRTEGLLRCQRHFIFEKLIGQTDKNAALAAGYSLTVAKTTKQKIWARPGVRTELIIVLTATLLR